MKTEIGRKLRSEATKRAESHPVNVERALMAGSRRYWWKVLAAYAAAAALILLMTGTVLLGSHHFSAVLSTEVKLTAIAVSPAAVSLQLRDTTALAAQLTYSDESTGPATAADWTSSNSQVAAVDDAGMVTAVAPGTATITATQSGVSGISTVTVTAPTVTGLIVTPATVSLLDGDSTVLTAELTYSDGSTAPATAAVWTSNHDKIAQVHGAVTATVTITTVDIGTATITATQSGVSGISTVTVTARPTTDPPVTETTPPSDGGNVIE